jgi:hypothetical protein
MAGALARLKAMKSGQSSHAGHGARARGWLPYRSPIFEIFRLAKDLHYIVDTNENGFRNMNKLEKGRC